MVKKFNWNPEKGIYVNEQGLTPYHYMRQKAN
jgi:hypothetical protein